MAAKVPQVRFANGAKMPQFGYGTWLSTDETTLKQALRVALDAGYRLIDTAALYLNEHVIGDVLQEYYDAGKLKRSDIFLTTKLPPYGHHIVDEFVELSLKRLRTDYIDLYLIHMPMAYRVASGNLESSLLEPIIALDIPVYDTWRQLERHYKKGTLRAIGVSNFNAKQLQDLYDKAKIKPHSLQIEVQITFLQRELIALCKKMNILVTGYGTLGSTHSITIRNNDHFDCLGHPLVVELAMKYNKTPAQILLRQSIQRGLTVIPKSLNPQRIEQNIRIFDFNISDNDMARFDTEIKCNKRLFAFYFGMNHPMFPFEDVTEIPK